MNKSDALDHYEEMARAALYPELVACLRELIEAGDYSVSVTDDIAAMLRFGEAHTKAVSLLSRLPAERDKVTPSL